MTTSAEATRARLMTAALEVVRAKGLAAASARTIAAQAQANQALIFYHFGTISELIEAASAQAVEAAVARYRGDFAAVTSLPELLAIGTAVHERERRDGSVTIMAQLTAGAQYDPVLARATRHAFSVWTDELEQVLRRVLATSPLGALLDIDGLAHVIGATFIGVELIHGADPDGAERAFATLERLNALVTAVDGLGPVAQKALRVGAGRVGKRAGRATEESGGSA